MKNNFVSSNFKYLLGSKGISQTSFSNQIGWPVATVNKYVNNKTEPDIDKILEIAKFFNVSTDDLIGVDMMKEGINTKKQSTKMSGTSDLDNLLRGLYKEISILTTRMGAVDNNVDMLLSKVKEYKKKFPNAAVWEELADELKKINYKL